MDEASDWVTNHLIAAPETTPAALLFLIRQYLATGRLDVRDGIESGLARSIVAFDTTRDSVARIQWLFVYDEAATLADDGWMAETVRAQLPGAIDALEQGVRARYEPGDGMVDVDATSQLQFALALLDAFALSGRVPYAMLAEELMRTTQRHWFDAARASFGAGFAADCAAVSVLCRLAGLHHDPGYIAEAVVAADADYEGTAAAISAVLDRSYREEPEAAAQYGLCLLDRFALHSLPN